MKRLSNALLALLVLTAFCSMSYAQLPGPGNNAWVTQWEKTAPATYDPEDPNAWMFGEYAYSGLAYDTLRKVLYVVSPSNSRIYAFNYDDGSPATQIGNPFYVPAGQLFVDPAIIHSGFNDGMFSIYKIDIDDEGRIYACNLASPGIPFRIYRWDTDTSLPQLVYELPGNDVPALIGTVMEVKGKRHYLNNSWYDSTRIYTCTSAFGPSSTPDELRMLTIATAPHSTQFFEHTATIRNPNPGQERLFGSGLTVEGYFAQSPLWVSAPSGIARRISPPQPGTVVPNIAAPVILDTLIPSQITQNTIKYGNIDTVITDTLIWGGLGSVFSYFTLRGHEFSDPRELLLCGNPKIAPPEFGFGYVFTGATALLRNTSSTPFHPYIASSTPPLGQQQTILAATPDNRIADIDVGRWDGLYIWPTPHTVVYPQLFYLSSNNGIGCYLPRNYYFIDPVELSSFTAQVDNGTVQLAWSTASETNNYGFEIERSFGDTWERIGFVEGHGTTTAKQEYTYSEPLTPAHQQAGVIQYRLRQVDFDGTFEYSPVVEVALGAPTSMSLHANYPNPFAGSTSISYTVPTAQSVTLTVYNTLGQPVQLVEQEAVQGCNTVQLTGLKPGMYMVVLRTASGAVTRRMVGR